jgi:DNA-binding NtrC family response regulator
MSTDLKLQKRLFLADDDPNWTKAMLGLFKLRGYAETRACNDAQHVITEALAFNPDVLLIDLRWDKAIKGDPQPVQGPEILKEIKRRNLFPNCYVAALTQELKSPDVAVLQSWDNKFPILLKSLPVDDLIARLKEAKAL